MQIIIISLCRNCHRYKEKLFHFLKIHEEAFVVKKLRFLIDFSIEICILQFQNMSTVTKHSFIPESLHNQKLEVN